MGRTITALETQQRHTDRVSVYLDGEYAFGLPSVEAARLRRGQVLSDDEIASLRAVDAVAHALDHAVRLLARRPYSAAEIRRSLERKGMAPSVIEDVLARLAHMGYVDDRAFAQYWIENRERFRPLGPRALRYELRQKGVADDIISAALEGVDTHASAYQAAQAQARRYRGQDRAAFRQKLGAFLVRRGFAYEIASDVIEQLIGELDTTQPDYFAPDDTSDEE